MAAAHSFVVGVTDALARVAAAEAAGQSPDAAVKQLGRIIAAEAAALRSAGVAAWPELEDALAAEAACVPCGRSVGASASDALRDVRAAREAWQRTLERLHSAALPDSPAELELRLQPGGALPHFAATATRCAARHGPAVCCSAMSAPSAFDSERDTAGAPVLFVFLRHAG